MKGLGTYNDGGNQNEINLSIKSAAVFKKRDIKKI